MKESLYISSGRDARQGIAPLHHVDGGIAVQARGLRGLADLPATKGDLGAYLLEPPLLFLGKSSGAPPGKPRRTSHRQRLHLCVVPVCIGGLHVKIDDQQPEGFLLGIVQADISTTSVSRPEASFMMSSIPLSLPSNSARARARPGPRHRRPRHRGHQGPASGFQRPASWRSFRGSGASGTPLAVAQPTRNRTTMAAVSIFNIVCPLSSSDRDRPAVWVHVRRRLRHGAGGLLGLGECNDVTYARGAGKQHDEPVEAECDAAVGRCPVLECIQEKSELRFLPAPRRDPVP